MQLEEEIDLRELGQTLWKHKLILFLIPLLAVITSAILSFFVLPPVYEASATLLVNKGGQKLIRDDYTSLLAAKELVKTYNEIVKSRTVAEKVAQNLGGELKPEEIQEMLKVSLLKDTIMLTISAEDTNQERVAHLVNTVAYVFADEIKDVMAVDNVKVVDPAVRPEKPVKPKKAINIAMALVLGFMVAAGLIFLLEFLDDSLKTPEDVEKYLEISVLGIIPRRD
ncbi:YveK family protein [Carboxydocella sp. ULO1]|uniref:YveK family protein n=1 Tax=Carboxydocella sp. ULO1 TaxID=1926599 RepID=UPI0009AE0C01|nr:Wzz/FepE/Etk N-terminal domain-containing protein [Carboxydocella sp. ULO1]GAW28901.1 lipopolysaccharide biosynthesis [Carboxydocella sp. ULO1]